MGGVGTIYIYICPSAAADRLHVDGAAPRSVRQEQLATVFTRVLDEKIWQIGRVSDLAMGNSTIQNPLLDQLVGWARR